MRSQQPAVHLAETASIRPYTSKDLASLYGVGKKTLNKWMEPFRDEIGVKLGRYYTIAQVRTIFDRIGLPEATEHFH